LRSILLGSFIYCPFCDCVFLTDVDLKLHLACFGRNPVLHGRKFRFEHSDSELDYFRFHGGADKVVRDIADAVLDRNRFAGIRKKRVR